VKTIIEKRLKEMRIELEETLKIWEKKMELKQFDTYESISICMLRYSIKEFEKLLKE
jgi:hypothetical protein